MKKKIKIKKTYDLRLDKYLKLKYTALTQGFIEKNIRKKNIVINNKKTMSSYHVQKDDLLEIFNFHEERYKNKIIFKKNLIIDQKLINLFHESIIYENKNFLVLNKWSGIATQGGSKIKISIDDIIKHISSEYKLVHRLDKDTSGLLIISKNLNYANIFGNLFKLRLIDKTYLAICDGVPQNKESIVNLDLKNKKNENENTETYYKVLCTNQYLSFVMFKPKTGKTHQLRKVAKNLSSPIIGDIKYNNHSKLSKENLKLNAYNLVFKIKNKNYEFTSKLPLDFLQFLKKYKFKNLSKIKNLNQR